MTVYVDELMAFGWILRGREVDSCHMFSDSLELDELHQVAAAIGMRRTWFQPHASTPHYDLTASRRAAAIAAGAVAVDRRQAVSIWRARRAAVAAKSLVAGGQPLLS